MAELRTFVFSDLTGSVELKSEMPGGSDAERDEAFLTQILLPHRERVEAFTADFGGRVVSTAGDGHFLVFGDAVSAAKWAIGIVRNHEEHPLSSPSGSQANIRVSMHLGSPQIDPHDAENFIGKAVDYAARLNDFSAGGQILVSRAARAILEDAGLNGVEFHAHGRRELKGIGPVEVHELLFDGRKPQDTRRKPSAETPREWTTRSGTVAYSKIAGLVPDGQVPTSTVVARPTRLGNYELGELVGAGGMGDVFKARHSQFGRLRAVKVIKPHLVAAGQHEIVKRFYQEIKAIGGLEHPNIVVAIDSSTPEDETHFLVMEYIDGTSAGDLVERFGPMSIANACEVARQAALGLAYIADRGMVHRDIKPSNLMVTTVATPHLLSSDTPSGSQQPLVKILDLGLALLVGDDHERLTRLDYRAMGTAMYMSPEQWRTTSVDIRSDIYSLGCTLYHLLSGKPPFLDSDLRPEKAHERSKVPPIRGGSEIPRPLWNLIRKTLSKDPAERYQSPLDLANDLATFAAGNNLVALVEQARQKPSQAPTQIGHATDTLAGNGPQSDTQLAGKKLGSTLTATPVATKRWLWGAAIALLLALGVGAWFADQARQGQERLRTTKRENAVYAARTAAKNIAREVRDRFQALSELSSSKTGVLPGEGAESRLVTLQNYVTRLDEVSRDSAIPENEFQQMWDPLSEWLGEQKKSLEARMPAESWFVALSNGTQVARAPHSLSVGSNYASRDYFHGQGSNLPEGTTVIKPVSEPHRSAVYESTSTHKLKVAFSVPVRDQLIPTTTSKVSGVLAMSLDLGSFLALEDQLPPGKEVLLVDLREDEIDGTPQRGLILHHNHMADPSELGNQKRLSPELLAQVEEALKSGDTVRIIEDYPDPLGRKKRYWCAVAPVEVKLENDEVIPTDWVVLVQEPL
ncbi:protein kinase domain-containing protein [Aeoliella sp. SH292]|uniref:protein kinase domain-containing protein n=1 Tax=Aeoliella sp. SH292 TaxID=3454464 RepID=UPI003F98CD43